MLPLKIVRSLVFGDASSAFNHPTLFSHHHHPIPSDDDDDDNDADRSPVDTKGRRKKTHKSTDKKPVLVFLPTRQLVTDTYALANLARSLGIDIRPDPSLSRIVFAAPLPSAPSPFPSSSDSPSTSTLSPPSSNFPPPSTSPSSFSFSFSVSSALENGVALPFPSLSSASLSQLQSFVAISKGFFRIALLRPNCPPKMQSLVRGSSAEDRHGDWDCCSYSLFSRASNRRVDTMDGFCRVLAGSGWTFFRTRKEGRVNHVANWGRGGSEVYLFRKVDLNRVRVRAGGDECRVRELRLPFLDFGNAPLRILQYVLLMTDDVFYLA